MAGASRPCFVCVGDSLRTATRAAKSSRLNANYDFLDEQLEARFIWFNLMLGWQRFLGANMCVRMQVRDQPRIVVKPLEYGL